MSYFFFKTKLKQTSLFIQDYQYVSLLKDVLINNYILNIIMSLLEIKKREICSQIAVYNPLSTWIVGHLWKHTKCTTSKFCIMTSQCYPWINWRVMKTQNGKSSDMPIKLISVTTNLMCYVLKFIENISSSHCIDNL